MLTIYQQHTLLLIKTRSTDLSLGTFAHNLDMASVHQLELRTDAPMAQQTTLQEN